VISQHREQALACSVPQKSDEHLTQNEAAAYLGISRNGLLGLVRVGALATNQLSDFAPWRVSRAELDSERVQRLVRILKHSGQLPKGGCPDAQKTLFPKE
jgi:hypothetical protein